jgi:hypothetical protein
VESPL